MNFKVYKRDQQQEISSLQMHRELETLVAAYLRRQGFRRVRNGFRNELAQYSRSG